MSETRIKCKNGLAGTRVLLKYPDPDYDICHFNPLVGTPQECAGVVKNSSPTSIRVQWDNGSENVYKDNELILFDGPAGICEDIWQ